MKKAKIAEEFSINTLIFYRKNKTKVIELNVWLGADEWVSVTAL